MSPPQSGNRLTIAHLLLWTTATALVLAGMQRMWHSSLPLMSPEPASDVIVELGDIRILEEGRSAFRQMQRLESSLSSLALIFSPAYGAALAAAGLAAWRLATRRGGFPTQPGHWLLLTVASVLLAMAWPMVRSQVPMAGDVPSALLLGLMGGVLVIGGWLMQPSDWRFSFFCAGGGMLGLALTVHLEQSQPAGAASIGMIVALGTIPAMLVLLGIVTSGLAVAEDIQSRAGRDLFHWLGLATAMLVVAHLVLALIVRASFL